MTLNQCVIISVDRARGERSQGQNSNIIEIMKTTNSWMRRGITFISGKSAIASMKYEKQEQLTTLIRQQQ